MSDEPTLGDILSTALTALAEPPLMVRAAHGDLEALRALANASYESINAPGVSRPLAYMEAITMARLAATHGHVEDCRALVFLLSDFAAFWRDQGDAKLATHFEAQALHLAEALAADGDDVTGDMVIAAADKIPAAVYLEAQAIREAEASTCTAQ